MIGWKARAITLLVTVLAGTIAQMPMNARAGGVTVTPFHRTEHHVAAGSFVKVYDPSIGESQSWYINDHTFVHGNDGLWHLFGITHQEPASPEDEHNFAHATAPSLKGPWTKRPFALTVDPGYYNETHLWAPHVIEHHGTYYMFYNGGGNDHSQYAISLATSKDLFHWTRLPSGPLFRDGYDARDPYVMRLGGRWVIYYDATSDPSGGNHIVAYRTSTDLIHWSSRLTAYTDPSVGTWGGQTESPFVVRHGRWWYLFIGPRPGYVGTDVFRSTDPLHFRTTDKVAHIAAHAAEVIKDGSRWYVSSAGWGQGGVYLAPLNWHAATHVSGVTVTAPGYRATLNSQPAVALTELSARRAGGRWQNLIEEGTRGTRPYLGIGRFGDPIFPGAATRRQVTRNAVTLSGMRFGNEPVTADWSFSFDLDSFETSLTWHVAGPTTAPVWEAALSVDPVATQYGDDAQLPRGGDVSGFPRWTLASQSSGTLALAYREHSAWAEANHYFAPPGDGVLRLAAAVAPRWPGMGARWLSGRHLAGRREHHSQRPGLG